MKKKEKIIIENKELLKSFSNSFELNIWMISTFGMSAIRSPQSLQSIFALMEKNGIETYRIKENTTSVSFSLDEFRDSMKSFETKSKKFKCNDGSENAE